MKSHSPLNEILNKLLYRYIPEFKKRMLPFIQILEQNLPHIRVNTSIEKLLNVALYSGPDAIISYNEY